MEVGLVVLGLALAFANGANDNFKGVATLLGSETTSFRNALIWASLTTLAGALTALFLARALLLAFSGKGLIPAELVADPRYPMAVAAAAAATVLLATAIGLPISTTHALLGGLVGAAWVGAPQELNLAELQAGFVLPLLSSPLLAILATLLLYPLFGRLRRQFQVQAETKTLGLRARRWLDLAHFLSAGVVSFARGLNDAPKIAALFLAGKLLPAPAAIAAVAVAMLLGGLLAARRVAETMSHRITSMNPGQGFTANLVSGLIVVGASKFGLPVSTTHVSAGALFGIGTVTGGAHWRTIAEILLAWLITLPLAAALGALAMSRL